MKSLQKNSFDPIKEKIPGCPIYPRPIVKLSDIMNKLKDIRNLKKVKIWLIISVKHQKKKLKNL
jgi:Ni,Fe-hydrogenase III small subunit